MPDNRKWSRDWENFDWTKVRENISIILSGNDGDKSGIDVGMSREEFLEYLDWLMVNHTEEYYKVILIKQLTEMGLEDDLVDYYVAHPEELGKIVKLFLDKDSDPE